MKTVTTREVQHHFSKVLDWVDAGEEVLITRRGKNVALMISAEKEDPFEKVVDWPAVLEERKKAFGDLPKSDEDTVQKMRAMERY